MAAQNQAECKQAARKQASARGRTSTTVCRSFSSTTESFLLLLLLLLPHQNVSEIQRKQVSSLVIRSPTLLLSLSPPASPTAPCPQEIPRLSLHPRPLCSSAALCFCGGGLVQIEVSVPSTIKQAGARCSPLLKPSGYGVFSLLSGSRSQ